MKSNAMPAGRQGFTIIELMVSMGILTILFALTTINLTRLPSATSQGSSYDLLVSDLRSQQTKAMAGYNSATGATGENAYGVYFDTTTNSYTLFSGARYTGGTEYYTVSLDPNLTFTNITFPNSQVVFATGSGDIASGSASITNILTGDVKTLKLNKYGATE